MILICTQHAAALLALMYVELLCARCSDETINWIRFNKRCSFMVMRAWIWVSSAHRYERGENSPALFSLLSVTSHPYHTLTPYHRSTSSSLFFSYQLATQPPTPMTLTLHAQTPPPTLLTVLRALSMSMPWLQGTAGLARQSPALPRRETSTRCRRRYLKASAITRIASWVNAEVYWEEIWQKKQMTERDGEWEEEQRVCLKHNRGTIKVRKGFLT